MISLHPNLSINTLTIGNSNEKIWVIDNFVNEFESLVHFSKTKAYYNPVGFDNTLFPGMRDEMPTPYYDTLRALLHRLAQSPDGAQFAEYEINKCWISKVTLAPEELNMRQTIPHFDSLTPNSMAAVHYFNDERLGGTSFYRYHRASKLQLTEDDRALIQQMIDELQQEKTTRTGYINESDDVFERVHTVPAKPNRIVIYSGNILHSAQITDAVEFDKKSEHNRTSVNSFFQTL